MGGGFREVTCKGWRRMLRVPAVPTAGGTSAAPERGIMGEPLVAWAGDCMVRGVVELGDGRLSDQAHQRVLVLDRGHQPRRAPAQDAGRRERHIVRADIDQRQLPVLRRLPPR